MRDFGIQLIAGGTAGLCDALLLHPFDMMKVRQQLATSQKDARLIQVVKVILSEGPLSMYKGIGPVVGTIVPKVAVRFTAFHQLSRAVNGHDVWWKSLVCGMGAGIVEAAVVVTPSEVVKIRQQDFNSGRRPTFFRVFLQEGIGALYRGLGPTALRQAVQQGCKFSLFYTLKDAWPQMSDGVAGALANTAGAIVNTPLDVVKTRIQRKSSGKSDGMVRTFVQVYREEGIRAFGQGLMPRILRIAPAGAVQFYVFQKVQSWITKGNMI